MRITLLTNYDSASALALHYLSNSLKSHELTVFYTHRPAKPSAVAPQLLKLSQFEQTLLNQTTVFSGLDSSQVGNINADQDLAALKTSKPDLILSVRHMTILKDNVIEIPTLGVLNLHSGILPRYQGVMATFWAMKNREKLIGTTVHRIVDSSIDTGPVLATTEQTVNYQRSYLWNTLNLYKRGCHALVNAVERVALAQREPQGMPQSGESTYYSFPNQVDCQSAHFTLYEPTDSLSSFF